MDVTDWSTQQSKDKLLHNLPKVNVINNAIVHNGHCEPSTKYDHYNIAYETHMKAGDNERFTLKPTFFFAIRHDSTRYL